MTSKIPTSGFTFRLVSQEDTNSYYSSSETMLGQLTEVMSMDDVQVLYPKERITLYGINSNCELSLPIARSSFPSYFPFCFCSLLLQRRAVAALLSPGEVHGVVLCIALVFLSFLRFLLYSVDWTSVGHSLRCGSLGLETSTLNSFVDADRRFTDPSIYDKTLWPQHRLRPPNFGLL